ncbi:hypothetical protein COB55_00835 [Candidatus Wolfebacteria bacterium]|nr:MAG: hypothetical protein COB55_00835 [Candidatus Wolfebacteria bacterium]
MQLQLTSVVRFCTLFIITLLISIGFGINSINFTNEHISNAARYASLVFALAQVCTVIGILIMEDRWFYLFKPLKRKVVM